MSHGGPPSANEDQGEDTIQEKAPLLEPQGSSGVVSPLGYLAAAGLICITLLAQTCQQELIQSEESKGTVDKPSLTIWFNHTCMFLFGFPASLALNCMRTGAVSPTHMWGAFLEKQGRSRIQALFCLSGLALLYLVAATAWSATLKSISIPLVTAASRFDSVFVLIFTSLLTLKAPPLAQALSVIVCILGVIFIAIGQKGRASADMGRTSFCDFLAVLIQPSLMACYYMSFKRLSGASGTDPESVCILLSLIGLCNALLLWPFIPLSAAMGIDGDSLPQVLNLKGVRCILLNAALATAGNFSTFPALALTSPLFISLAMVLLLPMALVIDAGILHHTTANAWLICGSVMVVGGFSCSVMVEAFARSRAVTRREGPRTATKGPGVSYAGREV